MDPICFSNCADCGLGCITAGEWFSVYDDVWEEAWAGRRKPYHGKVIGQEILCVGCLEQRIGRKLTGHDIFHAPGFVPDRLRDRLNARAKRPKRRRPHFFPEGR